LGSVAAIQFGNASDFIPLSMIPLTDARRIEEKLDQCGISPERNSRITRYRKIIEEFTSKAATRHWPSGFDWLILHQALFEIGQLAVIVDELLKFPVSPHCRGVAKVCDMICRPPTKVAGYLLSLALKGGMAFFGSETASLDNASARRSVTAVQMDIRLSLSRPIPCPR
jgi:hypothetical protein